jgi:tetratricopeptide (TPR) repeat protein
MEQTKLSVMFEKGVGEVQARGASLRERTRLTLGWVTDLINLAISYGVTLYNDGRHDLCYRLYAEVAVQVLAGPSQEAEGTSEAARVARADLARALEASRGMEESDAAWCMRHAFDKVVASHQVEDRHIQALVELGQAAFARGDYEGSIHALKAGIAKFDEVTGPDPQDTPAAWRVGFLLLGHAYFAAGRYGEASATVRQGMGLVPDWLESGIEIQDQYLKPEMFQAQVARLGDHLAANPDAHEARFLYGYIHYFSGEKPTASRILRHHLQLRPNDDDAQELLGMAMVP